MSSGSSTNVIESYNSSGSKTSLKELSAARADFSAVTIGDHAIFGGGVKNSMAPENVVDAFDSSLTRSTPAQFDEAMFRTAVTVLGKYAIFYGGYYYGGSNITGYSANVYDSTLTKSVIETDGLYREHLAATTVGNYALFGGGAKESNTTTKLHNSVFAYTLI